MVISKLLLQWYQIHKRDLPWRNSKNPYNVWVSEIILQQTRISQGLSYYHNFIVKFPDISSLATAEITDILNVWQGLGYYSRAGNMHAASKTLMEKYHGNFPVNYKEILGLKGIGEYTAGAIASICFGEAVPAVDGNVKRIISRLYGITDDISSSAVNRQIKEIVQKEIDPEKPGDFNQALMDLGSTVCTPKKPECSVCPLNTLCKAYSLDIANELPVKYKKTKTRIRYFYYYYISTNEEFLIQRREKNDIWKYLYEFPLLESEKTIEDKEVLAHAEEYFYPFLRKPVIAEFSKEIVHLLSHQKLIARFIRLKAEKILPSCPSEYLKISNQDLDKYPFSRLTIKYLEA